MSEHVEHGFGPVWDGESRVLILGSMPSPKSRAAAYSRGEHPRERQQVEEGRGGQAERGRVDGGTAPAIDQGISGAITTALSSKSIACAERSDSSSPYSPPHNW